MSLLDFSRRQTLRLMTGSACALLVPAALQKSVRANPTPSSSDFLALQKSLRGNVVPKENATFVTTRQSMVWNKRVSDLRSPDAIVQVASAQDVVAAVKFARANRMKIAVRSGGHNYHGTVLRDGGLLLDLSRLRAIDINAPRHRASVQPAVKSGDFAAALAPHGLAFPVGHCSDVGLGGYILNGGFGWNMGEWGPACMSVTGIEMVTASGDLVYADEKHNRDLFWAARGAGPGFFAVVTRFDVTLYPTRPAIQSYAVNFDLDAAPTIAKWLPAAIRSLHPTVEIDIALGPIDSTGKAVIGISAVAFASSEAEASGRIEPLRSLPMQAKPIGPVIDQSVSFKDLLELTDSGFPGNKRMAGDQQWSEASPDALIAAAQHLARDAPPAPSAIVIVCMGGSAQAHLMPSPDQAALSRGGGTFIGAYAFWDASAEDASSRGWVRSVLDATAPYRLGGYIGEADLSISPDRARDCFSTAAWERLVVLKKKLDPDDLFYSYLTS
jgi:FAD/FMN-containing dehydrogenase